MKIKLGPLTKVLTALAKGEVEAVGFLLGQKREGEIVCNSLFRAENKLKARDLFEIEPWHVVQAYVAAEAYGLEVVALFHTHTFCPPLPSPLDVKGMSKWPLPWIIACPQEVRAWIVRNGQVEEVFVD
ncbi:MAG: M67 family metallopeptidase [Acidilobaceae archaeon]